MSHTRQTPDPGVHYALQALFALQSRIEELEKRADPSEIIDYMDTDEKRTQAIHRVWNAYDALCEANR